MRTIKIMSSILCSTALVMAHPAIAQTTYDSKSLVDSNTTSTSTVTSTNTNNNTNTSTSTSTNTNTNTNTNLNISSGSITNNNINTGDMTNRNINTTTSTNTNINTGDMTTRNVLSGSVTYTNNNVNTGDMTNRNINTTTSTSNNTNVNQNINTGDMTNRNINTSTSVSDVRSTNINENINKSEITQKVVQPPPTAIAPAMMSGGNSDLCTTGVSGAAQTQILGISFGATQRDENCERLKLSKTLFDMGMKVAAVATMCQDRRVFDAMLAAGTPCPYEGLIGEQAKEAWAKNPNKVPKHK